MSRTGQRRGRGTVAAVGLVVVSLLLGCQPDPVEEPEEPPLDVDESDPDDDAEARLGPQPGGTLRVGLVVDPVTLDPRFVVDDEGELIIDALFDPLVRLDEVGRPQPAAAERWDVDDDGSVFRLQLRDATFHDGSPVTAEDFKRTFDRIADGSADPPSFLAYLLDDVVGIEQAQEEGGELSGVVVEDASTLRIELTEPNPSFLLTLANPSLVPTPTGVDEDLEAFGAQPIGNGPFAMAGPREPGSFIRIIRHEAHHEPPLLDEVLFTLYDPADGDESQWSDLVEGQLQVAQLAPTRRDEAIELFGASSDGYRGPGVLDGVRSPVYLYGFDVSRAPFDDARLRRAISLAIDRDLLATEITEGTRVAATSLVPPGIPGAQPGACDVCALDPERARDLLDEVLRDLVDGPAEDEEGEASEQDGAEDEVEESEEQLTPAEVIGPITLTYSRGVFHSAIAERIAADLDEILGLEVDFQAQDLATFIQGVRRGDTPVFRLGWDATEPDPASYLYPLFHSSQIGLDNLTRYANDEVDELLDAARQSPEPGERRRLLRAAERAVLADLPAIPVLWYRHDVVVRPEVRDLRYSPLGRLSLSRAWLDDSV
jgi:oligopeptide transport system substrate-binding protein